jgi:isoaspartyl peptidase/L-asparaginase-like protein (Ntn-hydrolase superfamily)
MRACIAHEIDARIRFAGAALEEAAQQALALVAELGGQAGCIAVDATGNVALPFSTQAMPRGFASAAGPAYIAIFSDE